MYNSYSILSAIVVAIFLQYVFSLSLTAQPAVESFFESSDSFFKKYTDDGKVDYQSIINDAAINPLITVIENIPSIDNQNKKAFLVNAYNLWVIKKITKEYPVSNVQSIAQFFNKKDVTIGGSQYSLNQLEKENILNEFKDPRLHFVLVCAAVDCPPITNYSFTPENLEEKLEQQTKLAINDRQFLKSMGNQYSLSQIFKWYRFDFGGSKQSVINFINKYKSKEIPSDASITYYDYDWTLNDLVTNIGSTLNGKSSNRYVVSAAIPKGQYEIKLFNNLYSQQTGESPNKLRRTFFTTTLTALYGLFNGFNVGINTRYRKVLNEFGDTTPFHVLGSLGSSGRQGITAFGPQIRVAPFPSLKNFSIQSSYVFAIGDELEGNGQKPFIDWNGATWITQLFNDHTISPSFSLFTELDFIIEDIGKSDKGALNRFSTPATVILSYFPVRNVTIYGLSSYSPFWSDTYDYFYQYGLGSKYQLNPNFEIEVLVNKFVNRFLKEANGNAATYNLGFRLTF